MSRHIDERYRRMELSTRLLIWRGTDTVSTVKTSLVVDDFI